MLQANPAKRLTIEGALSSQWFWNDFPKKVEYISPKKPLIQSPMIASPNPMNVRSSIQGRLDVPSEL